MHLKHLTESFRVICNDLTATPVAQVKGWEICDARPERLINFFGNGTSDREKWRSEKVVIYCYRLLPFKRARYSSSKVTSAEIIGAWVRLHYELTGVAIDPKN